MKRALVIGALFGLALAGLTGRTTLVPQARAGDFLYGCIKPGLDAGSTANLTIQGGNQFMVSCPTYPVQYRVCLAGATCTATSTDAPIANDQQVDLCAGTSYTQLSLYKQYDGGNPLCCVYRVAPKTVCQTQ